MTSPTVMVTHSVFGSKIQKKPVAGRCQTQCRCVLDILLGTFHTIDICVCVAVIGAIVDHDFLLQLMNSSSESGDSVYSCKDVDNAVCFLLDDGAFVVAANHPDYLLQVI